MNSLKISLDLKKLMKKMKRVTKKVMLNKTNFKPKMEEEWELYLKKQATESIK
jgi:hypothetical protein